jgi:hypothetical protein
MTLVDYAQCRYADSHFLLSIKIKSNDGTNKVTAILALLTFAIAKSEIL